MQPSTIMGDGCIGELSTSVHWGIIHECGLQMMINTSWHVSNGVKRQGCNSALTKPKLCDSIKPHKREMRENDLERLMVTLPGQLHSTFFPHLIISTLLQEVKQFDYLGLRLDPMVNMKAAVSSIQEKANKAHSLVLAVSYSLRYDKHHSNPTICSSSAAGQQAAAPVSRMDA